MENLQKIRLELLKKKKKVIIQSPKTENLSNPQFIQQFQSDCQIYQQYLEDGKKIGEKTWNFYFTI